MSPCVATTRLSLVATITPHPVPQKRHGALFHCSSLAARSVIRFAPFACEEIPPAAAAIAAAWSFSACRRSSFVMNVSLTGSGCVGGMENERGRVHVRQQRDRV